MTSRRANSCEAAVIGAGPYGLSVAAHLDHAGFATRVFGEPMDFWRQNMPKGMVLRSPAFSLRSITAGSSNSSSKYDARDGLYKVLDVNARAWTWIALGTAAGIDFAAIQWALAMGEVIAPLTARKSVSWLYFPRDLVASLHEIVAGRLSPIDYLRSLRHSSASAVFAWDDPWPAALDIPLSAVRVMTRRLSRRSRSVAAALQSARLPS